MDTQILSESVLESVEIPKEQNKESTVKNENNKNNFDKNSKKILKLLLVLALPIALQNFLSALVNIIDNLMVSSFDVNPEICQKGVSAVLLVNQFVFVYQVIIFALAGAASVFISQFFGKNEFKQIPKVFGFSVVIGTFIGIVVTIISICVPSQIISLFFSPDDAQIAEFASTYLKGVALSFLPFTISTITAMTIRGTKKVNLALIATSISILINTFLNYSFMFGKFGMPKFGLVGAAYGTVIARFVEMITIISVSISKKYLIYGKIKEMFTFSKLFTKKFFKVFLPTCCNEIFWVLGTTVYLAIFSQIPDNGISLSALGVTQSIDKLVFVFFIGVGNATGVLIGNSIGNGENDKAHFYAKKCIKFSLIIGLVVGAITFSLSFMVPLMFNSLTTDAISLTRQLLYVFAIFMVVRSICFTVVIGVLRNAGDVIFSMILESITIWAVAVPLAYLGVMVFNLSIVWTYVLINCEEVLKTIIVLLRFKSKRWMKNVVNDI